MNTSLLLWSLLFSSIGLGYFIYGKRQKAVAPLFCGLGLMIYPYFVSNSLLRCHWGRTHGLAVFRQGLMLLVLQR